MKKSIIILLCAMLMLSLQMHAQDKKKTKKNKTVKQEQTVKPETSKEISPQQENKPAESKTPQLNISNEKKPLDTKPTESKPTTTTEPAPINVEQILQQSKPIIQEKPNGQINWTEQYIEAKGQSVIDNERFKNPAQAKLMAQRGAVVDAQRNLLEIIKGVNVTSETTVQDMITTRDYIYTRVDGVIKGAQMIGEPIEKNGIIEVRMRVPLYEQNGLAPAIYQDIPDLKKVSTASDVLNQIPDNVKDQALQALAFNLGGKKFDPSMFPIIVDENNNLVLDLSKLYDPKTGKFPKLLSASEEIMKELGFKKGVEVLNVLRTEPGKMVIDNNSLKKVNWKKIGEVAGKIGKFLLMLI
ncbi:MAG: hypothetical protein N2449_01165 [Bacteroidales bacterium]|nr:hypothetical protein [Bacteroidales bacterium]